MARSRRYRKWWLAASLTIGAVALTLWSACIGAVWRAIHITAERSAANEVAAGEAALFGVIAIVLTGIALACWVAWSEG